MADNALLEYLKETGHDVITVEPTEGDGSYWWDVYVPEGTKGYYADTVPITALTEVRAAGRDELLDFILTLDNRVADYDFTATLVKRLQDALKAEDEAAQSEGGA